MANTLILVNQFLITMDGRKYDTTDLSKENKMTTLAYKYEIGSDDDELEYADIVKLPVVPLPNDAEQLEFDETGFYDQILLNFDIYFDEAEIAYFVIKEVTLP